jgi:hypothetical protein
LQCRYSLAISLDESITLCAKMDLYDGRKRRSKHVHMSEQSDYESHWVPVNYVDERGEGGVKRQRDTEVTRERDEG